VTEQLLHHPKVGAAVEQMSGEAVTHQVRVYLPVEAGPNAVLVQRFLKGALGEPSPVAIEEERFSR